MKAQEYWDKRYREGGTSGYGSYGEQLKSKLKWLSGLDINSIVEVGCGDFNFGSNLLKLYPKASYFGYDISQEIVDKNREKYPGIQFQSSQEMMLSSNSFPQGDLLMCVDVMFHILDDKEAEDMLNFLEKSWTKYLVITAYERDEPLDTHVRIRKFDYKRFGEPIIREVVEEDGSLYFYLFKKQEPKIDFQKVSACLITKDPIYPPGVLKNVMSYPFGEIMILTNCDSPHRKQELFAKAKYDWIFYQDDDCISPISELAAHVGDGITCAMKPHHVEAYKNSKIALVGWGAFFPKKTIKVLDLYRKKYGEDEVYKRETERIMTYLNFPQNRVPLNIIDLPSAMAPDRISMQPGHYDYIKIVEERCRDL